MKKERNYYIPEILGLEWSPGHLIMVASDHWGKKSQFVLGNCILDGTKDEIPVAYFLPDGDSARVRMGLLRLQAGARAFDSGRIETEKIKELPVYFDDTPGMTIAHIIDRLFFLSETKDIRMAVIDGLQDINTSQLNVSSRERELNSVLRLLKTVAEALDIVIIVKSSLSEYNSRHWDPPTVRDILDVTEAKTICDQIILLHRVSVTSDYYKMILPLGHPFIKYERREMVINIVLDKETGYFRKADSLYKEDDAPQWAETPMYEWYRDDEEDAWHFHFLDSAGMGWEITISPRAGSEKNEYDIDVYDWACEHHVNIALAEPGEDMDNLKAFALREARWRFPDVDITDKG